MIDSFSVDCAWVGHPSPEQAGSVYFSASSFTAGKLGMSQERGSLHPAPISTTFPHP